MNNTLFYAALVLLTVALAGILNKLIGIIGDEFREGHRSVGFAMIGMIVAIVVTALPWWML